MQKKYKKKEQVIKPVLLKAIIDTLASNIITEE